MRGPIRRLLFAAILCPIAGSDLWGQESSTGPVERSADTESPAGPLASAEEPTTPPSGGPRRPQVDDDSPPAEDPPPFTDAYPPTVDNLAGRGLFNLLDPFPLAQLHLQLPVDTLRVMKKGDGNIEWNFHWANSFVVEDSAIVDAETWALDLGGWYAIRSDFYVGASLSMLARGSGVLDGLVDGFHETFGLSDGGRGKRSNNTYLIAITNDNGSTQNLDRGVGLGDLVLKTHWNLNRGDRWLPAVAVETFATLPTSTDGFGSSGVDLGLSVSFYKTVWEDFHLYGMVGGTLLTNRRTEGIKYQKSVLQAMFGAEYVLLDELSLIFQHMTYSGLLREPSPLDKHRNYVAFGVKWEFTEVSTFELSLIENLSPFENSSDIAFSLGFKFNL